MNLLSHFKPTIIFGFVCLVLAFLWGLLHGPEAGLQAALSVLTITAILAVLELSVSFDNAVVNASILKHWDPFWQKMFLTVGMLIAVFGMRLVFPIVIVSCVTGLNPIDTTILALNDPKKYSEHLLSSHNYLLSFGGIFLWLVFSSFLFDKEREILWLKPIEKLTQKLAITENTMYWYSAILLGSIVLIAPRSIQYEILIGGVIGIVTYIGVEVLCWLLEKVSSTEDSGNSELVKGTVKAGIGGFIYLEILDASFSLDGVLASLAVTNDIVVIMLGLAIGAMAVRCLTIYMLRQGTLEAYRYLEHGAMYAIGVLALIMLGSSFVHLPEVVIGLISAVIIGISIYSSIKATNAEKGV